MSALAPWLATHQPINCKRGSGNSAMLLKRFERISRTSWLETTGAAEPRTEQQAIRLDQPHQRLLWQMVDSRKIAVHMATRVVLLVSKVLCIRTSNSARTASFNAAEDALGCSLRVNSRRSLTRNAACGKGDVKQALTV